MSVEAFLVRPLYPGFLVGGLVSGLNLAPSVSGIKIAPGGDSVTITFDTEVEFGAGGNAGFAITPSGGAATLTYASGSGTRILVYSASRSIDPAETATMDYTQPGDGVQSVATGDDLETFSGTSVSQPGTGGGEFQISDFGIRL